VHPFEKNLRQGECRSTFFSVCSGFVTRPVTGTNRTGMTFLCADCPSRPWLSYETWLIRRNRMPQRKSVATGIWSSRQGCNPAGESPVVPVWVVCGLKEGKNMTVPINLKLPQEARSNTQEAKLLIIG